MAMRKKLKKQKGFSLVEMLLASSVMAVVIAGSVSMQNYTMTRTRANNDKAFATQKAMQMFEELRAYVQANRETDISKLQNFSDGSSYNHVLTTEKKEVDSGTGKIAIDLENPADPLSGNQNLSSNSGTPTWKYLRQIQVKPIENDANARYVTVSVWRAKSTDDDLPDGPTPLATISGILKTNISQDTPTQMYDLFVVAMENAPSWWVDLADLKPSFERTLIDLEQRNPGLVFRRHYVSRFGFGRDPYYMPYVNSDTTADAQNLPFVYLYPGRINHSSLRENYVLNSIKGRRRSDDDIYSINKTTSPVDRPYSLSDQFNHVMRYPEQKAMEDRLIRQDPDNFKDNPSLVTFLEDLNNSSKYKNAIIVNLHGELIPLPAIRNFSDAAKAPEVFAQKLNTPDPSDVTPDSGLDPGEDDAEFTSLQYKRVVAHPENLRYDNDDTVNWRVYAYEELPPGTASLPNTANEENDTIPIISLFIPTIGQGASFAGAADLGFLNYPNFTPAAPESWPADTLRVRKLIGSDNNDYEWWGDSTDTLLKSMVTTHNIASSSNTLNLQAMFINGDLATNSLPVATTVEAGDTAIDLQIQLSNTDAADLVNTLIVLDGGTDNEEVVRVTSVTNAGSGAANARRRLNLNRPLDKDHDTLPTIGGVTLNIGLPLAPIVKHKDYEVEVINETMFGAAHRGIRVKLYDTRTRTPLNTASDRGLRDDRRLDGLEYIPAPLGSNFNQDLTDNSDDEYKNTARWQVSLDTGSFGTGFDNQLIALETRMVPVRSSLPTGCNQTLNELCDGIWGDGDPYVPDNLSTTSTDENETQMRENLYNVSRTYTYMNHRFSDVTDTSILGTGASTGSVIAAATGCAFPNCIIPKVEQFQYLADPRLNPYLDVKRLHRYNRHFEDLDAGGSGMSGFNRAMGRSWDRDDLDLNWFFHLYSNGIMRSNAIYNSITGYSNYYYAHGGELGSDNTNAVFPIRRQPWNNTDTGTASVNNTNSEVREIIENGSRVIMSTTGSSTTRWRMHNYNNELFPDDEINFWKANGNLPSLDYNNSANNADSTVGAPARNYFRATADSTPRPRPSANSYRRISTNGAPSFMNGNTASDPRSSNYGLQHISVNGQALLTNGTGDAGKQLVEAFNLILSDSLDSNRPYILNSSGTAGGYSHAEVSGLRNRLQFINTTTGAVSSTPATTNVYYRHSTDVNTRVGSAIIKLTRPNPSSPTNPASDLSGLVGYVLMNGLQEAGTTGVMDLARFTQAGSLQTYMDAGDRGIPGNDAGRTVQLPRVKISEPRSSEIYDDPSTITAQFNVAWLRWDDQKYSPAYPNNWYDQTQLQYNIKYSPDNKRTWIYANTSVQVERDAGTYYLDHYNPSYNVASGPETVAGSVDKTFNWGVSGLAEGNYVLRIEAYRNGFDTGYSYHDVFVTIER